jgi:hypothetical protein
MNGERVDPIRLQQVVGYLFRQYFNKQQDDRYFDIRRRLSN